ncbi:MAG TPA: hypothetical protein VHE99_05875 [Gammaproteobacteria bacterium]|nr:hypothetical protein [Gammaproteobacteria bacterium]
MNELEKEKQVTANTEKKEKKQEKTDHASVENSGADRLSFKDYMRAVLSRFRYPISIGFKNSTLSGWLNPITESQAKIVIDAIKRDLPDKHLAAEIMLPVYHAIENLDKNTSKKRFTQCLSEIQQHANAVYFSDLIRQCKTKEAVFFRELLTAAHIKFCYLNPYLLTGTRVPGWKLAHKIKDEIFSYRLKGSTDLKFNKKTPVERSDIDEAIGKLRDTAKKIADSKMGRSHFRAQLGKQSGFANCQEYSEIVIDRLIAYGFSGNAEIYCIEEAELNATSGIELYFQSQNRGYEYETRHAHVFVVMNRDLSSNPHDATTWGPHALIIDTWSGKIYPAYDIFRRLECWYRLGQVEDNGINYLEPYDPRKHIITPHSQLTLEAIKSWRIKHGISSEPGEFKKLQSPPLDVKKTVTTSTADPLTPSDTEFDAKPTEPKPPCSDFLQSLQVSKHKAQDTGKYSAAQLIVSRGLLQRTLSMSDLPLFTEHSEIKQKPRSRSFGD